MRKFISKLFRRDNPEIITKKRPARRKKKKPVADDPTIRDTHVSNGPEPVVSTGGRINPADEGQHQISGESVDNASEPGDNKCDDKFDGEVKI